MPDEHDTPDKKEPDSPEGSESTAGAHDPKSPAAGFQMFAAKTGQGDKDNPIQHQDIKDLALKSEKIATTLFELGTSTDTIGRSFSLPSVTAAESSKVDPTVEDKAESDKTDFQRFAAAPKTDEFGEIVVPLIDLKALAMKAEKVATTILDHGAVKDVVSRSFAKQSARVTEELRLRAAEPLKPLPQIENYKTATPCSSLIGTSDSKERCTYCPHCKIPVYDFTGLELAEAEKLIFKWENRENAPLYKRADGRFLTVDCPVAIKAQRDRILAIVGGSVLVVCVLALLLFMPRPAPTVVSQPKQPDEQKVEGNSVLRRRAARKAAAGSQNRGTSDNAQSAGTPTQTPQDPTNKGSWSEYIRQANERARQAQIEASSASTPAGQVQTTGSQSQPADGGVGTVTPSASISPTSAQPANSALPQQPSLMPAQPNNSSLPQQSSATGVPPAQTEFNSSQQGDSSPANNSNGVKYYGR
jgi:hypothetical protein